jgi:hypothetical protein
LAKGKDGVLGVTGEAVLLVENPKGKKLLDFDLFLSQQQIIPSSKMSTWRLQK